MTSHMYFPIHSWPSDYWRFTPAAFKSLLGKFSVSLVESVGLTDFPHTVIGVGFKREVSSKTTRLFRRKINDWKQSSAQSWKEMGSIVFPPFLGVYFYRLCRKLAEMIESFREGKK